MSAQPVPDPQLQLMMSFARIHLGHEHIERIHTLGPQITDWSAFATKNTWHFTAPLCLYHLAKLEPVAWVSEAKKTLKPVVRSLMLHGLKRAASQKRFVQDHLQRHNIPFLLVKGRALGSQFYPEPSLRPSRDIDVWVAQANRRRVIESAQATGSVTYPQGRCLNQTELSIHIDKREADIGLIDPDGAKIELDRNLDKSGLAFQFQDCFKRSRSIEIDGVPVRVLSIEDSFIYACLHHARHGFLRLIWLADLDAIQRSPEFDIDSVMRRADELGLRNTVEACLGFYQACGSDDPIAHAQSDDRVTDILETCIAVSDLKHAAEVQTVKKSLTVDFLHEWQLGDRDRGPVSWIKQQLLRFRPALADYEMIPLPASLYPLYYVLKIPLVLVRRTQRILGVGKH